MESAALFDRVSPTAADGIASWVRGEFWTYTLLCLQMDQST